MSIENKIREKLSAKFSPLLLNIENESHKHSSGRGAESHFKITLVTEYVKDMKAVTRHRAVYQCLNDELENGVHALAIHIYTPSEWNEQGEVVPNSPNCLGHGQ